MGAGVGFVDLEQGWFVRHEEFTSKSPAVIYGDNDVDEADHGTAVLGIVVAGDDSVGVVGIAPAVSRVLMTSHYDSIPDTNGNVAGAIVGAFPKMDIGDVLLVEVQRSGRPAETDHADFDAIRLAAARGIVVLELAGNIGSNLDTYTDSIFGDSVLHRNSCEYRESGAIIVGAAEAFIPHERLVISGYGSRVDCYAWGEVVVSCGYGDLGGTDDQNSYTGEFAGTSSAAAIVAGAAIIVQGMYRVRNNDIPLAPLQMRSLLCDRATGTP